MFSICISLYWIPANFGIATYSEAGYWEHQVEGYTEQQNPRDRVELVRDNNFDTLSKHDKYIVLEYRFVPEAKFDSPKIIKHGCNRSLLIFPIPPSSIVAKIIAVYCIYCVLFFPKTDVTYWVHLLHIGSICGYREWHYIMEKDKKSSQNTYHQEAITLVLATIDRLKNMKVQYLHRLITP